MNTQLRAFGDFWSMGLMLIRGVISLRDISPDNPETSPSTVPADPLNAALSGLTVNYLLLERLRRETILNEMRARELLTNDYVMLSGGLESDMPRTLQVNGLPPIFLDRKEFLVMLMLARPLVDPIRTLDEITHPGYVSLRQVLKRVGSTKRKWLKEMGDSEEDFWTFPSDEDVRKLIWQVRGKLKDNGGNRNLIQTGLQRLGYRFSCPRRSIDIEVTGAGAQTLLGN